QVADTNANQNKIVQFNAELGRSGLLKKWQPVFNALTPSSEARSGLLEMARNPYLLTMIIDVFLEDGQLDQNRAKLMARFAGIEMNWARAKPNREEWLDFDIQRESLSVLAFEIQKRAGFGTLVKIEQIKEVMPETVQPDPRWPPVPAPRDRVLALA